MPLQCSKIVNEQLEGHTGIHNETVKLLTFGKLRLLNVLSEEQNGREMTNGQGPRRFILRHLTMQAITQHHSHSKGGGGITWSVVATMGSTSVNPISSKSVLFTGMLPILSKA